MNKCPYCHQPLTKELDLPDMSLRQSILYHAIVEASINGIRNEELAKLINSNGKGSQIVVRVAVSGINKLIRPLKQKIRSRSGVFKITNVG